jgi:hypothetical protein
VPIANGFATRNFPNDHRSQTGAFVIRGANTGDEDQSLLKFDLSSLGGKRVNAACLVLHRLDPDAHLGEFDVRPYPSNAWTEETLTWGAMSHEAASILASGSVAEGGTAYLDVTPAFSANPNSISLFLNAHADVRQTVFHGRTNPWPSELLINHGNCAPPV